MCFTVNMARPKSDDKRNNILAACQAIIVRDGLNATTTADIAKEARIATGSLFTYFPTKTDLLNELYITLKTEMTKAMSKELMGNSNKEQLHSAWAAWTDWAAANSEKHMALELLRTSDQLTQKSRDFGNAAIKPVFDLINANITDADSKYPQDFLYELIDALSIKTMDKMAQHPERAAEYREAGFEAVWKIITKEQR